MNDTIYYLDVDIEGCDAAVYLNRAPIVASSHLEPRRATPTVNEWLLQGSNELAIAVLGAPGDVRVGARVRLCRGQAGDVAEPDRDALLEVSWSPTDAVFPARARAEIDLQHPWGTWQWTNAPTLHDDAATRAEVIAEVRLIHGPLSQGNPRGLLSASEVKLDEVGRCYGIDLAAARARFRSVWSEIFAQPGFAVASLEPDTMVLRRFCDDRLVSPMTASGTPVIRQTTSDGAGWSMPLLFARVDGSLVVVR